MTGDPDAVGLDGSDGPKARSARGNAGAAEGVRGTAEDGRSREASRVIEWTPEPVRSLLGDWLVELYSRDGSKETDVE